MSDHSDNKPTPSEKGNARTKLPVARVSAHFQGPLPPPSILERYGDTVPNGAERIFVQFEEQSRHRRDRETEVIRANIDHERRGQNYAFYLSFLIVVIGGLLIWQDKSVAGLSLILGDVIALAVVFVIGREKAGQERQAQRDSMNERQLPLPLDDAED
jgi:uncharacterized membrane protein